MVRVNYPNTRCWCQRTNSTKSLSFWLSWSFDMVSRVSVTKRSRVRISSAPPFSVEYFAPGMREACAASTLQTQRALAWGGVIEYKSILGASTISLNFWLSWSFDSWVLHLTVEYSIWHRIGCTVYGIILCFNGKRFVGGLKIPSFL